MLQSFKSILSPIDFSEFSLAAMLQAWDLAREIGAHFHVLHVVSPQHLYLPAPLIDDAARTADMVREADLVQSSDDELRRIKQAHLNNSSMVIVATLVGQPVAKIREYAAENQIGLITMSTHGRSGLEHMLIGSVAEKLVRSAGCAVMVVRPALAKDEKKGRANRFARPLPAGKRGANPSHAS